MRRHRLLIATIGAAVLSVTSVLAADVVTPPGSSFGLVPPAGFEISPSFAGFVDRATTSSYLFVEMPPEAYAQMREADDAAFAEHGIEVASREDFSAGELQGFLISGTQDQGGITLRKWLFLFPASSFTGMVAVTIPRESEAVHTEAEVRATLASLAVGVQPSLEAAVAALPFSFQPTDKLRIIKTLAGNGVILTIGSKIIDPEHEQPSLLIAGTLGVPCVGDRRAYAEQVMRASRAVTFSNLIETSDVQLAGGEGIALVAQGTAGHAPVPLRIYMWVGPFDASACLQIMAVVRPEMADEALPEFRSVVDSVRLKAP